MLAVGWACAAANAAAMTRRLAPERARRKSISKRPRRLRSDVLRGFASPRAGIGAEGARHRLGGVLLERTTTVRATSRRGGRPQRVDTSAQRRPISGGRLVRSRLARILHDFSAPLSCRQSYPSGLARCHIAWQCGGPGAQSGADGRSSTTRKARENGPLNSTSPGLCPWAQAMPGSDGLPTGMACGPPARGRAEAVELRRAKCRGFRVAPERAMPEHPPEPRTKLGIAWAGAPDNGLHCALR
jgi:hypothetical protein